MTLWLDWLAEAARLTGYPVVQVEGWERRGHGPMRVCEGVVGHHTGTPTKALGDYPSLSIVKNGRDLGRATELPGPLANLGLGRSGTVYVIAAGTTYHAGVSAFAGFTNLNDEFIGIEAESPGDGTWTDAQRDAYPKLVGALLFKMQRGPGRYVSHRACALPAGRKVDPAGLSDSWMMAGATRFMDQLMRPAPVTGSLPTLHKGEQSADVMALQVFLTKHYPTYAKFVPTGLYGELTVAAVKEFQARVGITGADADGTVIGPKTNAALWAQGYRGRG